MNIAIIWKNDYPWDVRIEKIALSLINSGHNVHLICSNNSRKAEKEIMSGIHVHRLPCYKNSILNSLVSTPFYLHPVWILKVYNVIKDENIELLMIRDIPLMPIGLLFKYFMKMKLILDMAENYPAIYRRIVDKEKGVSAIKFWIIKNPHIIRWVEHYATKYADIIFVVVDESKKRIINNNIDGNKIFVVGNTPELSLFEKVGVESNTNNSILNLVYVGFVQQGRGLDTVVGAVRTLKEKGVLIKFVIIGDGYYLNNLRETAKKYNVDDLIEFKGWIDNKLVPQYISECDIGVIPHKKSDHTDTTIPNKLFDYMACSKPVIVSNSTTLSRIVKEENIGVVFKSEDEVSFVKALQPLIDNQTLRFEMGKNGRNSVKNKYNWAHDFNVIEQVINNL